jgi:hypothetical protein
MKHLLLMVLFRNFLQRFGALRSGGIRTTKAQIYY